MSIFRPIAHLEVDLRVSSAVEERVLTHDESVAQEVGEHFESLRMPLYSYVLTICKHPGDAEELTQESFLRLYAYLRAGNYVQCVRAWVFRVAHNLEVNLVKTRKPEVLTQWPDGVPSETEPHDCKLNPEELLDRNQRYTQLWRDVQSLTEHQRQCLHLRSQGFRYKEIAQILGVSVWSVSDALDRGVKKLRRSSR